MKRSEMVELLLNEINDLLYTDSFISRDEANLILTKIEKAGMTPPQMKRNYIKNNEIICYQTCRKFEEDLHTISNHSLDNDSVSKWYEEE